MLSCLEHLFHDSLSPPAVTTELELKTEFQLPLQQEYTTTSASFPLNSVKLPRLQLAAITLEQQKCKVPLLKETAAFWEGSRAPLTQVLLHLLRVLLHQNIIARTTARLEILDLILGSASQSASEGLQRCK